ncbi:MAG TPA: hypothetical protein PL051_00590 [Candidatus Saccharibacteria bacterium]|nr:hypothetical protein [Candidatus Saccharibacteria bacterium]
MSKKIANRSTKNSEVHLFILWEKARTHEKEILQDIKEKFSIVRIYEVTWSKEAFSNNLSRFYGAKLPPNSNKEQHCGTGPFLAVIVEDTDPVYETHTTTKGDQHVNTKLFTSKALHREWTGGGHRVHGSNTVVEADQNLTLLFGKTGNQLLREVGSKRNDTYLPLAKNLEGYDGWQSLEHLLTVLNSTTPYVVLRNFDSFPHDYYAKDHGDIDLLVADYAEARYLLNATPVFKADHRVHFSARIANDEVRFDIRSVGDGYYDTAWQQEILESRVLNAKGFYTPSADNYVYSLLYHALVHKPAVAGDYAKKLFLTAKNIGLSLGSKEFDTSVASKALVNFLLDKGYIFTQPRDKSVYVNMETVQLGKAAGIRFSKNRMTPLRNHLKKAKSRFKHYRVKARRIINRNIRKILSKDYGK